MIHYSQCPLCSSQQVIFKFDAKDNTVSGRYFPVWKCNSCSVMFTQDVPEQEAIGAYYASENYISHSDSKKGLINKLYHAVRKKTLSAKTSLVQKETKNKSGNILDIGCGTGAFLNSMKNAGWEITGLEPDEKARHNAHSLYGINAVSPTELFNLDSRKYDAITMWHVLEHVHQLHEYVEQLKRLLAPNGRIFIAVPNYTSKDAAIYQQNWAAYDVPRHLYHFSPESMQKLMGSHGLVVDKIKPMWYDGFYVSMLSEQYRSGKGNIPAAFFKGLSSNIHALFHKEKCSSQIYIIRH